MPALDLRGEGFFQGVGRADFHLDMLGGAFAYQQVVFPLQVRRDGFIHFVSGHAHGAAIDDSGKGNDGDIRGAPADIDNHAAGRLGNGQARADGRHHRLLDQEDLAGAGAHGGILYGAFFHLGDFRGHADDNARMDEHLAIVGFLNKVVEHLLRHLEIGNDAVFQGADGDNVAGRAAQHFLGFAAHGFDVSMDLVNGHDGGFVHDDPLTLGEHQGIGGAQVNGKVGGKNTE